MVWLLGAVIILATITMGVTLILVALIYDMVRKMNK